MVPGMVSIPDNRGPIGPMCYKFTGSRATPVSWKLEARGFFRLFRGCGHPFPSNESIEFDTESVFRVGSTR